jgi:CRISPR-associated protein Csx3
MVNLLPAVLIGGPPHAGKSVLFYSLTQALRERNIRHHAIRACPDGEGNWSQESDQHLVDRANASK